MNVLRIRTRAAIFLAVVAAFTGCEMTAEVTTQVSTGGRATFAIVLAFDKQLLDVVRQNAEGAAALDSLAKVPAEFSNAGWTFRKSEPNGGLRIETRRRFPSASALNTALALLRRDLSGNDNPAAALLEVFKEFEITRTSGFLKSQTRVNGVVDVTPGSLFGSTDIPAETQQAINDFVSQQASQFFKFRVRADLAGKVTSSTGDPEVSGGTAVWTPKFGRELRFSATASAYNPFALLVIGFPFAALLAFGAWRLFARRRPVAAVPGWEVGTSAPEAVGEAIDTGAPGAGAGAPEAAEATAGESTSPPPAAS